MAEGVEEAETNSSSGAGDATTSMLSAAMPCEVHEFETYHQHHHHQAIKRSVSISPTPKIIHLMPHSMRKVNESSNDSEHMPQNISENRLHQHRKQIATKRKHSTDTEKDCPKLQPLQQYQHHHSNQQQQQQQQQQQDPLTQQHQQQKQQHDDDDIDDQLSQSSYSSSAPFSPSPKKFKTETSRHSSVKYESLSPMPILENDQDGSQHVGMNDATKVGSESSDGKEQTIDEDIVHDDSEAHILEQSQDVANLLNSQNALAAAAAAAAAAVNSVSTDRLTPDIQDARLKLSSAAVAHINGTMQKMLNFQNLQNLASLQQQKLGFVGLAGLTTPTTCLNSPLNLSLSSSSHADPNQMNCSTSFASELAKNLCGTSNDNFSLHMPQLILASGGQLMQGVQVAQLLIPSPQGVSTQTILTIPVSQQVNSNEQLAQTLAALNSCPTNQHVHSHQKQQQQKSTNQLPNLLASPTLLAQQSQQPSKSQQGPLNANLFPTGVQELLAEIQPHLFDLREQPSGHHRQHSISTNSRSPNYIQSCANDNIVLTHTPKHSPIRNSQFENRELTNNQSSASTVVSSGSGASSHQHPHAIIPSTSPLSQYTSNGDVQILRTTTPPHNLSNPQSLQQEGNDVPIAFSSNDNNNNNNNNNNSNSERSIASNSLVISSCSGTASSGNSISREHSPNIAINSINRLTTSNGELTITKSQGLPPAPQPSTNSTSSKSTHSHSLHHQSHRILSHHKSHHAHHQTSSTVTTPPVTETTDDDPNEPTINQTNCNVVDGIDLDEIKEFAKAFKLRRLSLGLTQTQVGQALSVTEGPAYSQSAICRFEKLDITPKSAQKIKPVLERWMKEAEERHWNHYKSGQSHLTDFIGVEPSKKRKRRTSFTPQALELLNAHFERNTHPSGTEITGLAHQLGYEREVIRIWFCNKRQALKNTVRMMSKGMV